MPYAKPTALRPLEEETLPLYRKETYYPVKIGETFASRYQVVSKLGYGTSSTVWLCRDLSCKEQRYYTLKVSVKGQTPSQEIAISDLLNKSDKAFAKRMVRLIFDSFEVAGPHGKHTCLLYQPLGMNFSDFQVLYPDGKIPKDLLQRSIQLTLIALALMHEHDVVHTDLSPNNILQGIEDTSLLSQVESDERQRPSDRKVLDDRIIYQSRAMPVCTGLPVISDLGDARVGRKHKGDIMPGIYRAPEVILGMEWDEKIDVWSIGTMVWDLAQGHHLFFAKQNGILNDEQHLAEMMALVGPPPKEFLQRSELCGRYWDADGNWKGSIPTPDQSFETRELQFSGEDKLLFINFLRRIFRWLPEERPTAEELAYDDFLMQPLLASRRDT